MQLQESVDLFRDAGLGIAVVTYDSPALQAAFIRKFHVTYPLLSDVEARTVSGFGVLNQEYEPGDDGYGVPHPGVFVVDAAGSVVDKIFIESYTQRLDHHDLLSLALRRLDEAGSSVLVESGD